MRVEVDVHRGLPAFAIVGLPDAAVREARERVRAALVNCGFEFPLRRIVVNLAPASLRKAGPGIDLAIAAALLGASDSSIGRGCAGSPLVGELALDGSVRPIAGALAIAEAAREGGARGDRRPRRERARGGARRGDRGGPRSTASTQLPALRGRRVGAAAPSTAAAVARRRPGGPDLADLRGQPPPAPCARGGRRRRPQRF